MLIIFGVAGLITISIAVWIRKERKQDVFFIVGGLFLLIYSVGIRDIIFSILQIIFIISAFAEIIKLRKRL